MLAEFLLLGYVLEGRSRHWTHPYDPSPSVSLEGSLFVDEGRSVSVPYPEQRMSQNPF
jgi:hypothetical protein